METKNPRQRALAGASISIAADTEASIKNHPIPQPDSVTQLRALRLIASHHVRPAMALALAGLVFGEAR